MASRLVVLTGASSGIGAELAVQLAARGDRLALIARRYAALQDVATHACAAAREAGHDLPDIGIWAVDVTDRDSTHRALAEIDARFGEIDVLVLNAGIGQNLPVESYDDRLAARILDVNLTSTVYALGAVLPGMVKRKRGHVVGISSIAGYRGLPDSSAYCASKAGFTTLLESLRLDLRRHGVAVTTVSPGFVRSPMTDKNRHSMPFLLETAVAVRKIVRGIDRRRREVRFPWPLVTVVRLLRAMPDGLYDAMLRRVRRPASADSAVDPYRGAG